MNKYSTFLSRTPIVTTTKVADMKPMKVIDMSNKASAKAYLSRPVEDTHSKEEMDAILRAIRYTQMFKQDESLAIVMQQLKEEFHKD